MIGFYSSAHSEYGYIAPAAQAHIGLLHPDNRQEATPRPLAPAAGAPSGDVFLYRKTTERPIEPSGAGEETETGTAHEGAEAPGGTRALTTEEQEQVDELQQRDEEVRRHEEAHVRAGGQYAGAPKYEYQTGPDGKRYAVGGSVDIDTSEVPGDPRATLEKARIIKRAALAPDDPSSQDRKVAREAEQMAAAAMRQLSEIPNPSGTEHPPAAATAVPPHDPASDTNTESASAAGDVQSAAPERSMSVEIAPSDQSLRRYRTAQLKQFYLPITSRLNDDTHRIPLLPLFDQYA